jgi:ferredoxin-NADP reductase
MSKYSYDKKGLKGLTPFPFLKEVKTRTAAIEAASDAPAKSWYNPNEVASQLHPEVQHVRIKQVIQHPNAKSYVLVPDIEKGTSQMAYFRAGQYVSVSLQIDNACLHMPYTIRSNPADALAADGGSYTLTIKESPDGYASKYILENWKEGSLLDISGPLGEFYYEGLRDAKHVLAAAGGSGITPFYSMAAAISSGIEDFDLTILYGSRTEESILLKDELSALEKACDKVHIVHVLSDEEKEGYEHGLIQKELLEKYGAKDSSVFVCGPGAMQKFIKKECEDLGIQKRRVRLEVPGEYRRNTAQKDYRLKVKIRGEQLEIPCRSDRSLLWAMEQAGIHAPSRCRSGICGWCHSRLTDGDVFIPEEQDGRRIADCKFGWIHPCCTFPDGDVSLEVYPAD